MAIAALALFMMTQALPTITTVTASEITTVTASERRGGIEQARPAISSIMIAATRWMQQRDDCSSSMIAAIPFCNSKTIGSIVPGFE